MLYDIMTLPNGLRVIGLRLNAFRSVSIGLWIGSGSQYENESEAGLSHFLEHMLFKGTQKRTARDIAEEMDAVGGQMNAYTAKESTLFYTKVVDENLSLAMDVISDMAINATFDAKELEKEKGVVIEEIDMCEDTPEDLVSELIMPAHYGNQAIALPILGTEEKIASYTRDDLVSYWNKMYRPQNAVLALTGNYDWNEVIELSEKYFGAWTTADYEKRSCVTVPHTPGIIAREKDIEQIHICLGYPGLKIGDERSFELTLFSSVFGGEVSSRLFQKIREELGAAYSVYSCPNAYTDTGLLTVYAGTNPDMALKVIEMIRQEAQTLAENGMTEKEFTRTRTQMKAGYVLGLESTSSRMQSIGRRLLLRGNTRTEEEVLARIEKLDYDRVNALMKEILSAPTSVALVGKSAEKVGKIIAKNM